MKHLCFTAIVSSFLLVTAFARTLFAGVVMAETSTAKGPDGQANSQVKTIYLQGNKQRVDRQNIAAITDLDKNIVYIVDKQHRAYAELPLQALSRAPGISTHDEGIKLDRTGKVRMIANQPCSEYRASEGDKLEHVTISACVSTSAPGAREISEFERKMIARLDGHEATPSSGPQAALMLEKRSVVSFRIPDPSPHRPYRTASLLAETRVNNIQLKPLPPETFKPPKGFNKIQNGPQQAIPPLSPDAIGHTFDVMGRSASADGQPADL
jgi:hypothetical protein